MKFRRAMVLPSDRRQFERVTRFWKSLGRFLSCPAVARSGPTVVPDSV